MRKLVRIIFITINVLIVIALLASSIAGWIPPSKCIWISYLSYGFLLLVAVNIAASLLWLFFKRWEFLISLIAILLRFNMIPLFIQVGGTERVVESEQRSASDELKVMTYNLHGFNGKNNEEKKNKKNAALFLEIVKEECPDVICAQEMNTLIDYSVSDSLKNIGYRYQYSVRMDNKGHPFGATVISRSPINYVQSIDKSGRKIYADITKDKFKVRVVCVHMSSYSFGSAERDVLQGIKNNDIDTSHTHQLFTKVKDNLLKHEAEWNDDLAPIINESPYPIVLAGDFNDTPASHLYYKVSRKLKDAFVEQGKGFSVTYNGSFPAYRIDYIFHSDTLNALAYKCLDGKFSDHNGVMATFELKRKS